MTTLFKVTLELAKILGRVFEGVATDTPTTTTLADTLNPQKPDFYNLGTLWVLSGAASGTSVIVTDYDASSKESTFGAITSPSAGDRYAITTNQFPYYLLRQAVNQALQKFGATKNWSTSLVTVKNQAEYTLPTDIFDVRRVKQATAENEPFYWQEISQWEEVGDTLILLDSSVPVRAGFILALGSNKEHVELVSDGDLVENYVNINRLKWEAAVEALRLKYRDASKDPNVAVLWQEAISMRDSMRTRWLVPQFKRQPKLAGWMGSNAATRDPALNN